MFVRRLSGEEEEDSKSQEFRETCDFKEKCLSEKTGDENFRAALRQALASVGIANGRR